MNNLSDLSDSELSDGYRAYGEELERRRRVAAIPQEISDLAQQGRDAGVEDSVMVEAITRAPEEVPAVEGA